ncbi:MAG: hypothetical protein ABFD82_04535 [Syntrophaceae bacterium]
MLDNEARYPARTNSGMSLIMRLLTGAAETYSGTAITQNGGRCGPVLGMSESASASAVCKWINSELPYSTKVCLISDGTRPSQRLHPMW